MVLAPGEADSLMLRKAVHDDLEAITTVAQKGFPDDPEWDYNFPFAKEYPEDNRKWTLLEYKTYLDHPEKYAVLVVSAPGKNENGDTVHEPISVAVWDMAVLKKAPGGHLGIDDRRDGNPVHLRAFHDVLAKGFNGFFASYGEKQTHLWLLVTHPDFRRRGAGTMLVKWGIAEAAKRGWISTVLGSPMGTPLYQHCGFILVGTVVVRAKHEKENFQVWCLETEPNDKM